MPSDVLALPLSVAIDRADVQKAKDDCDRITKQIYELAESQGIPRPRLLTTDLRLGFDRESSGKGGSGGKKGGPYVEAESGEPSIHISRHLEVRFENLPQAVSFVGAIVNWDSVRKTHELRLIPLRLDVADRKSPSLEARRHAVENARERAALLAEQTGLRLGDAIRVYDDVPERAVTFPDDDPFGGPYGESRVMSMQQHLPTEFRLVAASTAPSLEELDLDQLPPAQVELMRTVSIVYEARKR